MSNIMARMAYITKMATNSSTGADDMLHVDSADVRNTEQRSAGSSAGECSWPTSWTGPSTLAA